MSTKIAILGDGNVGSALARGWMKAKHEVRAVGRDPAGLKSAAAWGDVVVLAVPYGAIDDVVSAIGGAADGKIVVDVVNPLGANMQLAVGYNDSAAEQLQKKLPRARVVKAFNTVFAQHMDTGKVGGAPVAALVAGDDADARKQVLALAGAIGFDTVDAGPLANARLLEPLAMLNIQLGYVLGNGPNIGFALRRG